MRERCKFCGKRLMGNSAWRMGGFCNDKCFSLQADVNRLKNDLGQRVKDLKSKTPKQKISQRNCMHWAFVNGKCDDCGKLKDGYDIDELEQTWGKELLWPYRIDPTPDPALPTTKSIGRDIRRAMKKQTNQHLKILSKAKNMKDYNSPTNSKGGKGLFFSIIAILFALFSVYVNLENRETLKGCEPITIKEKLYCKDQYFGGGSDISPGIYEFCAQDNQTGTLME